MAQTKFGVKQVFNHPPKWVLPTFAVLTILIQVASFLVSGDNSITDAVKLNINHYFNGVQMLISLLAPLFGVDLGSDDNNVKP